MTAPPNATVRLGAGQRKWMSGQLLGGSSRSHRAGLGPCSRWGERTSARRLSKLNVAYGECLGPLHVPDGRAELQLKHKRWRVAVGTDESAALLEDAISAVARHCAVVLDHDGCAVAGFGASLGAHRCGKRGIGQRRNVDVDDPGKRVAVGSMEGVGGTLGRQT